MVWTVPTANTPYVTLKVKGRQDYPISGDGQTLPANKVLQHGALPCALTADHRDLRQVQVAGLTNGAEGILQLVDQRDQLLHATISHGAFSWRTRDQRVEGGRGDVALLY